MVRSRLAPTPSGYLHLGNAINFIITWLLVRQVGGVLALRLDDADKSRCREEYVEDVFRQLAWLGLDWDEGPQGPDEFNRHYSQRLKMERYRALRQRLVGLGHSYICDCSRQTIRARVGQGVYPGFCRQRKLAADIGAYRLRVAADTMLDVAGQQVALAAEMGDFVVWRRDDTPSYQLASLVDDLDGRINYIVRGADLLVSSAAQLFMAQLLGEDSFAQVTFLHHPLLTNPQGGKLSKSDQALSLQTMREQGVSRQDIYQHVASFLGLDPQQVTCLADLSGADLAGGFNPNSLKGGCVATK